MHPKLFEDVMRSVF
jgi:hypothetical protein